MNAHTEKKVEPKQLLPWSRFMVRIWILKAQSTCKCSVFNHSSHRHTILQTSFLGSKIGGLPTRLLCKKST